MGRERRRQLLLGALVVVLLVAAYRLLPGTAGQAPAASNVGGAARAPGGGVQVLAPDVHLESLERERPKPGNIDRNLFRFKSAPAQAAAPPPSRPIPPVPPSASGPGGPSAPSVSAIPFKFIGILEVPGQSRRLAVLSDPRGVYHGGEGDIIEGRYRILKIGTESIELAELDGRGRQTLRLSGQ